MTTPEEGELVFRVKKMGQHPNERYYLGLPGEIGKVLDGKTFMLTFTDDGLLYRQTTLSEGLPDWLSTIVREG